MIAKKDIVIPYILLYNVLVVKARIKHLKSKINGGIFYV